MNQLESPASPEPGPITDALLALRHGDEQAIDRLVPLVYDELRRIAHALLRRQRTGHTLSTTGLVHEVYLRMVDQTRVEWNDRRHFFAVASRAMRQVLVDYARRYRAAKRGGAARQVPLREEDAPAVLEERADTFIVLDEALTAPRGDGSPALAGGGVPILRKRPMWLASPRAPYAGTG